MKRLAVLVLLLLVSPSTAQTLTLEKGDHICIIGNAFGERMQHHGWLETMIHHEFPEHELVFRNLAYSGDEIAGWKEFSQRLRSRSFGSQDEWLAGNSPVPQPDKLSPRDEGKVRENRFETTNTNADVIFAFFGYNESRRGPAGLADFKTEVTEFIEHILSQQYNGKSSPRLVLFSPWPLEYIDDANLPSREAVAKSNDQIKQYAGVMGEAATAKGIVFVDLTNLAAARVKAATHEDSLTTNGLFLNERGDAVAAAVIFQALFGRSAPSDRQSLAKLRAAVNDKNAYWYQRYRATDGYSTFGDRAFLKFSEGPGGYGDGLSNYSVTQRELEVIDVMTANRDRVVWAAAAGKTIEPDDSNLPEFIPVISNKPGPLPDGKHVFLSGEEAIASMTVAKNMKVNLFADEAMFPELVNPVQMAFDTQGRLWVAAWRTYPHWKPTEAMDDKLLILEDADGDGRADVCKTFAADLHNPTGFEFWNRGVIVGQGPDIIYLEDTDGDDKYDIKQRLVHGVDTADTHHTANSFTLDPGGAMYFQEGTFHHSQVETPWGAPRRVANGAVFRLEPRTSKCDIYVSFGFANPHGHVFDRWGQDFVYDGTGAQPYHGLLFSGDLDYPRKHGKPPQVYQQRTRPCSGVEILSSSHFPEELRGNLLVNNVIGFQGILQYRVEDKESSFTATEVEPIVSSADPNFRPADVEVGPDGAIYFTDWHNPIIGHMQHNLRDPNRDQIHGRVYRVTYEGRDLVKPPRIAGQTLQQLLNVLKEKDDRLRYRARIELSSRPTNEVLRATEKWLNQLDDSDPDFPHHVLESLWLHQNHNVVNLDLLGRVLRSSDFRARAAATRVLAYWHDRVPNALELLQMQVNDEHPRVRLQAIWALSFFDGAEAAKANEILVESLIYDQDEYIKHAFDETAKTLEGRAKQVRGG
ncbi:MAG: HEAT repeat domain-containing protein [Pirellulaceae bacterium]|nr:HEAT repeat domain-containing protein [Planctomycetales bacterium]